MKLLKPDYIFDSISDIKIEFLLKNSINALIIDIDNTLIPYTEHEADDRARSFLNMLKKEGIKVCLMSNNRRKRVERFNKEFSLPSIHWAIKPFMVSFIRAFALLGENRENIAIIGDQIFTDILGGNRIGIKTILVKAIDESTDHVKIKRKVEKYILDKNNKGK